ncbi:ABC-type transporter, integral membrane subunit [Actinobacteria bacterium OK074]|nr:ABC-type transporter, integral membrane subunit [Actinobacteria bacterium OK074]
MSETPPDNTSATPDTSASPADAADASAAPAGRRRRVLGGAGRVRRFGPRRATVVAGRTGLALVIVLGWQFGSRSGVIDPFFFSAPTDIAQRIGEWFRSGEIYPHLRTTLLEAALALAIGSLLGLAIGFLLARARTLAAVLDPYLKALNALPRVVLAPLFLLWFGLGIWSKVAFGVSLVFFLVFFNTYQGVREVDRVLIDNVRMLGAKESQLIRHVLLPSAMTWIFSSLHVSVGFAIVGAVVGEYLGSSEGMGYLISQAEGTFDTTGVFAGVVVLSAIVLVIDLLVNRVERHLLRWQPTPDRTTN